MPSLCQNETNSLSTQVSCQVERHLYVWEQYLLIRDVQQTPPLLRVLTYQTYLLLYILIYTGLCIINHNQYEYNESRDKQYDG